MPRQRRPFANMFPVSKFNPSLICNQLPCSTQRKVTNAFPAFITLMINACNFNCHPRCNRMGKHKPSLRQTIWKCNTFNKAIYRYTFSIVQSISIPKIKVDGSTKINLIVCNWLSSPNWVQTRTNFSKLLGCQLTYLPWATGAFMIDRGYLISQKVLLQQFSLQVSKSLVAPSVTDERLIFILLVYHRCSSFCD